MQLVIHDLSSQQWNQIGGSNKDRVVVDHSGTIKKCIGCFGCWVKTPGKCIIPDDYQKVVGLIAQADELIIVSRCTFGSYSSFVTNVVNRSIGYILPFFQMKQGEMHHKPRYTEHQLKMSAYFYGEDITKEEKETAAQLVRANAVNFNAQVKEITFVKEIEKLKGMMA